jgi:hypothetical protein
MNHTEGSSRYVPRGAEKAHTESVRTDSLTNIVEFDLWLQRTAFKFSDKNSHHMKVGNIDVT